MGKTFKNKGLGEQADGKSKRKNDYHSFVKKSKSRMERRKSNRNPEEQPTYNKYKGYET